MRNGGNGRVTVPGMCTPCNNEDGYGPTGSRLVESLLPVHRSSQNPRNRPRCVLGVQLLLRVQRDQRARVQRDQRDRSWRTSDRDGDRATSGIVRRVGAGDAATACITPTERVEMEERVTGCRQATAARGARHGSVLSIADRGGGAGLGVGGLDHRGHLPGWVEGLPHAGIVHPEVRPPHTRSRVGTPASGIDIETGTIGLRSG